MEKEFRKYDQYQLWQFHQIQCPNPVEVVSNGRHLLVGCGKCPHCQSNRKRAWADRFHAEQRDSDFALFLTLTYDNDHLHRVNYSDYLTALSAQTEILSDILYNSKSSKDKLSFINKCCSKFVRKPLNGTLQDKIDRCVDLRRKLIKSFKKGDNLHIPLNADLNFDERAVLHPADLTNYLKLVRKYLSPCFRFKYYAVGEYGGANYRPHYHVVLFLKARTLDDAKDNLLKILRRSDKPQQKTLDRIQRILDAKYMSELIPQIVSQECLQYIKRLNGCKITYDYWRKSDFQKHFLYDLLQFCWKNSPNRIEWNQKYNSRLLVPVCQPLRKSADYLGKYVHKFDKSFPYDKFPERVDFPEYSVSSKQFIGHNEVTELLNKVLVSMSKPLHSLSESDWLFRPNYQGKFISVNKYYKDFIKYRLIKSPLTGCNCSTSKAFALNTSIKNALRFAEIQNFFMEKRLLLLKNVKFDLEKLRESFELQNDRIREAALLADSLHNSTHKVKIKT